MRHPHLCRSPQARTIAAICSDSYMNHLNIVDAKRRDCEYWSGWHTV